MNAYTLTLLSNRSLKSMACVEVTFHKNPLRVDPAKLHEALPRFDGFRSCQATVAVVTID